MMFLIGLFNTARSVPWAKLPWKWIGVGAGSLALIGGALWLRAHYIAQGDHNAVERISRAGQHAIVHIRDVVHVQTIEHTQYVERMGAALAHAREQIEAAPHDATSLLLAWARADRGLLDAAARGSG